MLEVYPQETFGQELMMDADKKTGLSREKPLDGAKAHTAVTTTKNPGKSISSTETKDPEVRE